MSGKDDEDWINFVNLTVDLKDALGGPGESEKK